MMRRGLLGAAVVLASLSAGTPIAAQRAAPDVSGAAHRQAAGVVSAFHAALARGDLAGAASLLSDDALIYESGGVERGKSEYASHHLPADAAFAKVVRRSVTRIAGRADGDIAWVATESRSVGSYKGKAIDSVGTETMVLRRNGRAWRIAHVHWSSAAARQAPVPRARR